DSHRKAVSTLVADSGVEGIVLEDFLSEDQMSQLRLATDILVYAPVSDAFSASVSQSLAAGNVVIVGAWLPYKTRQRAGFYYHEIDQVSLAGIALESVIENLPFEREKCEKN